MPIKDILYINETLNQILTSLLFSGVEVRRGKIRGYGLSEGDFDKIDSLSRKKFRKYKDVLLERKLIIRIKSKRNPQHYSITPLGMSYCLSELNDLSESEMKQIFLHLNSFYYYGYHRLSKPIIAQFNSLTKTFDIASIKQSITSAIHSVEITNDLVRLNFIPQNNLFCNLHTFQITTSKNVYRYNYVNPNPPSHVVDDDELHQRIYSHIISSFYYNLLRNTYNSVSRKDSEISKHKMRVMTNFLSDIQFLNEQIIFMIFQYWEDLKDFHSFFSDIKS